MATAEGDQLKILGFARRLKGNGAVVQMLRDHGIKVTGPSRTPFSGRTRPANRVKLATFRHASASESLVGFDP
jgi:hypothetical protein